RVHLLARGCKHRQRLLLIATRKCNLSVSPTLRWLPKEDIICPLRRSSGNHPICRVVIAQVKGCVKSGQPDESNRTKVQRHLLQKRLSRDWITLRQLDLS